MAILELRAARGWSRRQTARRFLLQPATVAAWTKRVDEGGERAILETPERVNRLPDLVRYIVKRLKVLCPTMGKKRIAQTRARAGLALGLSTVGRILKERETERPEPDENVSAETVGARHVGKPVQAAKPNDVWQIDLTVVPTAAGFWTAWFPFAVEQSWPFAWWVACVVDHYSRCIMGFGVFSKEPKSIDIRRFLGRVAAKVGATPRYIIADKGRQFDCRDYRAWCERRGIHRRADTRSGAFGTLFATRSLGSRRKSRNRVRHSRPQRDFSARCSSTRAMISCARRLQASSLRVSI
jgi:transposase InsO family protein